MPKNCTDEQIREKLDAGLSARRTAKDLRCSHDRVAAVQAKFGYKKWQPKYNFSDEQILQMLQQDYSVNETSKALRASHERVAAIRDKHGLPRKPGRFEIECRPKIIAMIKLGMAFRQIARECGVNETTVRNCRDSLRTPEQWAELRRYREANAPSVRNSGLPAGDYWADGDVAGSE